MKFEKKEWLLLLVAVITNLTVITLIFVFYPRNPAPFKCSGNYSAISENKTLSSVIRVTFADQRGAVVVHGVVRDDNGNASELTLSILFRFQVINKSYALTSTSINIQQENRAGNTKPVNYEGLLPGIFSKNGDMVVYTVYPQGESKFLFTRGKIPVFFCDGKE